MDQFILFGDSLTQQLLTVEHGFLGLQSAYIRRLDVVNRGFSGYNTRRALEVLPKFMPSPSQAHVRFMTIFFGANDARYPGGLPSPDQHVPPEEFAQNLRAIATHRRVLAHNGIRIILVTPPPVDERKLGAADREAYGDFMRTRSSSNTALYAELVMDIGAELKIPVLNLWGAMMARTSTPMTKLSNGQQIAGMLEHPPDPTLQSFLRDGLHLTRKGYEIWYEELMGLIGKIWPDQMPDKLPFVFPAWDNVNAWEAIEDSSLEPRMNLSHS